MKKIIAVILDENNHISEMREAKKLSVFQKTEQNWNLLMEVTIPDILNGSIADIRDGLGKVIMELKDCKIIVGKSVTGLVFNIFNGAGFIISELDEFDIQVLDELYSDIQKELEAVYAEQEAARIPTAPVETGEKGSYFFDFNLLKQSELPYTSKSTILPFLNATTFHQLEILCDHVMPWFDQEMKKRNLTYTVTDLTGGTCSILVKPVAV
jgi:Fe-only nitrogenase accessory protein AnfO